MLNFVEVTCPYCGEPQEINVDPSGGSKQHYTEDCQVCCRPWRVAVRFRGGEPEVRLSAEDETDGDE
jgi:hypothetical protein